MKKKVIEERGYRNFELEKENYAEFAYGHPSARARVNTIQAMP